MKGLANDEFLFFNIANRIQELLSSLRIQKLLFDKV